jgi:plasmid stability protein
MHRTTIMLPDDLKLQVRARARERGISLSEFTRTALEQALARNTPGSATDPLFADHEVFQGETPPDLAGHHDDYLYGDTG